MLRKVQTLLQEMLDKGIHLLSKSPWASPIILCIVTKKDGSTQFVLTIGRLIW